jgi:hypothetical protein
MGSVGEPRGGISPKIVVPLANMQKVETFVPIKASREEAATRCRSQQGFWLCQTGTLGSGLLVVVSMGGREPSSSHSLEKEGSTIDVP